MAHCYFLVFYKSQEDYRIKIQILRQFDYEPLHVKTINPLDIDKTGLENLKVTGFIGITNQILTIDSLIWIFPDASFSKITALFSHVLLREIRLAINEGLSISGALCIT